MKLLYTKAFKKSMKKLKENRDKKTLEMIKRILMIENDFENLKNSGLAKQYDFEYLKYKLSGYCSFRINDKNKRLVIFKGREFEDKHNEVILNIISYKHYKDIENKDFVYNR